MTSLARAAAPLALLALAGCPFHFSTVQTAETLGEGNMQIGLEPGAYALAAEGAGVTLPAMALALRYGISDRFDIGGRIGVALYFPHWDLQAKYQLTPVDADGPIVSIAPWVSVLGVGTSEGGVFWGSVQVPVLVGIPVGEHELVLGPRLGLWSGGAGSSGDGGSGALLFAGTSLGFAFRTGNFRVLPEVTVMVPTAGGVAVPGIGSEWGNVEAGIAFIEFRLGLLFGQTR